MNPELEVKKTIEEIRSFLANVPEDSDFNVLKLEDKKLILVFYDTDNKGGIAGKIFKCPSLEVMDEVVFQI